MIDDSLERRGAALFNRHNHYTVAIPTDLADGAVKVSAENDSVSIDPVGAAAPATAGDGANEATFREAWPGVDIAYAAQPDSVKETLTLSGPDSARAGIVACIT